MIFSFFLSCSLSTLPKDKYREASRVSSIVVVSGKEHRTRLQKTLTFYPSAVKKKLWVSFPANHDNALHKALRKSCLVLLYRIGLQKKERKAEANAQDGGSSLINSPLCARGQSEALKGSGMDLDIPRAAEELL